MDTRGFRLGKGRDPVAPCGLCCGPPASGQGRGRSEAACRRVPALRLRVISPGRGSGCPAPAGPAPRSLGACWERAGSSAWAPAGPAPRPCQESHNLASALPDREKSDRALTRAQSPRSPAHGGPAWGFPGASPRHVARCGRRRGVGWGRAGSKVRLHEGQPVNPTPPPPPR